MRPGALSLFPSPPAFASPRGPKSRFGVKGAFWGVTPKYHNTWGVRTHARSGNPQNGEGQHPWAQAPPVPKGKRGGGRPPIPPSALRMKDCGGALAWPPVQNFGGPVRRPRSKKMAFFFPVPPLFWGLPLRACVRTPQVLSYLGAISQKAPFTPNLDLGPRGEANAGGEGNRDRVRSQNRPLNRGPP